MAIVQIIQVKVMSCAVFVNLCFYYCKDVEMGEGREGREGWGG